MTTDVTTSMTGPNGAVGSGLTLRPGRPDDAAALSDLAFRSKAFWGYSDSLMAAFADELKVSPDMAAQAVIAEVDGVLAGFHLLGPVSGALPGRPATEPAPADAGELDMLFLDPTFIGAGVGRVLFQDAMAKAIARGWTTVYIAADPQSTGFYETCGAVRVGERLSPSVPGRFLPLLEKRLGRNAGRGMGARATYWR
jgi:GNAT superfamily N-acetyltransferase